MYSYSRELTLSELIPRVGGGGLLLAPLADLGRPALSELWPRTTGEGLVSVDIVFQRSSCKKAQINENIL